MNKERREVGWSNELNFSSCTIVFSASTNHPQCNVLKSLKFSHVICSRYQIVSFFFLISLLIFLYVDCEQVRELNFYQEGDVTHFNQELASCHIQRVWDELVERCLYEERREHIEAFNRLGASLFPFIRPYNS